MVPLVTSLGYLSMLVITALVSCVAVVLSLFVTNPLGIGPIGVTIWFLVVLIASVAACTVGLYFIKSFLRLHTSERTRLRYSTRQGLLIGGWVVVVLALGSLGQLGVRDAILLGLMLLIVEVYVRFRWP